jgi:MFS family permease
MEGGSANSPSIPDSSPGRSEEREPARSGAQLLVLLLISTMAVLIGAGLAPCLPAMAEHFGGTPRSAFGVRLVLTMPALATAFAAPLAGVAIDRIGRRPLLVASAVLYGAAGGSGFLLDSIPALLASRAALGLAVAGIMTTTVTLIADTFSGGARNRAMGLQAAFMGFSGVVYVTAAGLLADLGWRYPFLLYLVSFALLPLVLRHVAEPDIARRGADGLNDSDGGTRGRSAPFPVGVTLMLYGLAFSGMVAFYLVPVQAPFRLTELGAGGGSGVGIALAAFTVFAATSSSFYGRTRDRLSFQAVFAGVFVLMGSGFLVLAAARSYLQAVGGLVVTGVGMGMFMPNLNVWAVARLDESVRGRVIGGLTTCAFLGQFTSPLVSQPIASRHGIGAAFGTFALPLFGIALAFLAARLVRPRRGARAGKGPDDEPR